MSDSPSIYERIVKRREALDHGLTHKDELQNDRLFLDALELLFRPANEESAEDAKRRNAKYESMEEAAFAVAHAARTYVKEMKGVISEKRGGLNAFQNVVQVWTNLQDAISRYEETEIEYEREFR